jgi:ribosomal protein S12 methylthiotransferase accessory factor YcaO
VKRKTDKRTPQELVWEFEANQAVEQTLAELMKSRTTSGHLTPDEMSWLVNTAVDRTPAAAREHLAILGLTDFIRKYRRQKREKRHQKMGARTYRRGA